jgi:hypothetical protein
MSEFSKYIVYVDESGNSTWKSPIEFPILCLNFCMFEKDYYLHEAIPRFNRLKMNYWGCDNIVLHESDLRKPDRIKNPAIRSKYEHLKGERRRAFMDDLSHLMSEIEFLCFCVVIDKPKVPNTYQSFDPYDIGLSRGFRQIRNYFKNNHEGELEKELHIIFESRGLTEDKSLRDAYNQIRLRGSLLGKAAVSDFENFRLELMDKKCNSTGLQIADLTARPIGNHYLHTSGQKSATDQRAAKILLKKLRYCSGSTCENGKYDIFHEGL